MSNPTNWPIVDDGETYFRHNEKRVLHEQRRPIVGHGNIVGPGISEHANEVDDWNSDVAATNGYFWSYWTTPNSPVENTIPPFTAFDPEDLLWVGQSMSIGQVGWQQIRLMDVLYDGTEDLPRLPEFEARRQWKTMRSGQRVYGPWRGLPQQPIRASNFDFPVGTGASTYVEGLNLSAPPAFSPPVNSELYAAGDATVFQCTISIHLLNTIDTLGGNRQLVYWPVLDGSAAGPAEMSGDFGFWSHEGAGRAGFSENVTTSRTWFLFPTAGVHAVGMRLLAQGSAIQVARADMYCHQIQ